MATKEQPPASLRRQGRVIEVIIWYLAGDALVLVYHWPNTPLPDIKTAGAQLADQGWRLIRYQVEPYKGIQRLIAVREMKVCDG